MELQQGRNVRGKKAFRCLLEILLRMEYTNSGYQDDQIYGIERGVASEKEATEALNRSEIISDHFNEEMKTITQSDTSSYPVYKEITPFKV